MCWQYAEDLRSIARPLLDLVEVPFFAFHRYWPDGRRMYLCTHGAWAEHRTKVHARAIAAPMRAVFRSSVLVLWDRISIPKADAGLLQDAHTYFGQSHGMTLVQPRVACVDMFVLATNANDTSVSERYFAELERIERFANYFHTVARSLIETAPVMSGLRPKRTTDANTRARRKAFDDHISAAVLHTEAGGIRFSPRERDCLEGVLRGESAKEIAATRGLSHRTVEQYIGQIMRKTGVSSQARLRGLLETYRFSV